LGYISHIFSISQLDNQFLADNLCFRRKEMGHFSHYNRPANPVQNAATSLQFVIRKPGLAE
jgi:hypothetical protein